MTVSGCSREKKDGGSQLTKMCGVDTHSQRGARAYDVGLTGGGALSGIHGTASDQRQGTLHPEDENLSTKEADLRRSSYLFFKLTCWAWNATVPSTAVPVVKTHQMCISLRNNVSKKLVDMSSQPLGNALALLRTQSSSFSVFLTLMPFSLLFPPTFPPFTWTPNPVRTRRSGLAL